MVDIEEAGDNKKTGFIERLKHFIDERTARGMTEEEIAAERQRSAQAIRKHIEQAWKLLPDKGKT
jgi:hypothetical protein